jgi:hypothetical protein
MFFLLDPTLIPVHPGSNLTTYTSVEGTLVRKFSFKRNYFILLFSGARRPHVGHSQAFRAGLTSRLSIVSELRRLLDIKFGLSTKDVGMSNVHCHLKRIVKVT